MNASRFRGPLAAELSTFAATLEASAAANKAMLTRLRALDRLTEQTALPKGTLDEAFARTWLAPCESRGPNTRLARFHLLRRFCRFLAKRRPETFIPGPVQLAGDILEKESQEGLPGISVKRQGRVICVNDLEGLKVDQNHGGRACHENRPVKIPGDIGGNGGF